MTKDYHHLTLGEIVDLLRKRPPRSKVTIDRFPESAPTVWTCYRGYYRMPCLNYAVKSPLGMTARALANLTERSIGSEFEGYKGGLYVMTKDSHAWVGTDYGDCSGLMIIGIEDDGKGGTVIVTCGESSSSD